MKISIFKYRNRLLLFAISLAFCGAGKPRSDKNTTHSKVPKYEFTMKLFEYIRANNAQEIGALLEDKFSVIIHHDSKTYTFKNPKKEFQATKAYGFFFDRKISLGEIPDFDGPSIKEILTTDQYSRLIEKYEPKNKPSRPTNYFLKDGIRYYKAIISIDLPNTFWRRVIMLHCKTPVDCKIYGLALD